LVITEVAYLIEARLGWEAEVRNLGDLATGSVAVEPLHASDPVRIAELVAEYRDLPLGTVDASVIAAAERLDATEVERSTVATSALSARAMRSPSSYCREWFAPPQTRSIATHRERSVVSSGCESSSQAGPSSRPRSSSGEWRQGDTRTRSARI
jgi:hypothetical protein